MDTLNWIHISSENIKSLPRSECVYMIKSQFRILYIGQSVNLSVRFIQHMEFILLLTKDHGEIFISYAPVLNSKVIEKELIEKYSPLHNGSCKKKIMSDLIEKIKNLMDGRKYTWLSKLINCPMPDVSRKMSGKRIFTEKELEIINTRFKSKINY